MVILRPFVGFEGMEGRRGVLEVFEVQLEFLGFFGFEGGFCGIKSIGVFHPGQQHLLASMRSVM